MLQSQLLSNLISVLNANHIDYMITGSVVSSLQGEPRSTHDIDVVVNIKNSVVTQLMSSFPPPQYYLDQSSIQEAIDQKGMFNLIDTVEGDKIDFWILTEDPFDVSRFERKYKEDLLGFQMYVSTPEDTILAKLKWAKLSGGSEKQIVDSVRIYEIQYEKLNMQYLQAWVNKLNLVDLWDLIKKQAKLIE